MTALYPPESASTWTPTFRHHWGDGDTDGMDCRTIQEEFGDVDRLLTAIASIDLLINNGPQGQHPRWMFDCYADLPDAVEWWMNAACGWAMYAGTLAAPPAALCRCNDYCEESGSLCVNCVAPFESALGRVAALEAALLADQVGTENDPCWCDPSGDGPHIGRCVERRAAMGFGKEGP